MDRQKFRIVGLQEGFNKPKVVEVLQLVPTDRMQNAEILNSFVQEL